MSGWPSLDRADDERLAETLASGDGGALIHLMDRYAARLYDYCHALLRDQDSAAGALHDALIAATTHIGLLQEPERFRSWLYALARNQCLRRLADPDRPAERHEAPEVEDVFLDAGERAHRLETRRLVHGALSGLRGRERETLDLLLRHGLDAAEIGGALGIGAQEATDLAGTARARLDDALAAAVIARTGRDDCPHVAELAGDGEEPLTPPVSRRLVRHIASCRVCAERRDRTVSTARLLQVLPVALMPTDLRGRVLATATDPALAGELARAAGSAEPFDTWGWPVPVESGGGGEGRRRRAAPPKLWPAVAAAVIVLVIVAGAFMVMPDSSDGRAGAGSPAGTTSAPDPSAAPSESPTESESPTPTPSTTSPTPTPTTPTPSRTKRTRAPQRPSATPPPSEPSKPGRLATSGGCTITVQNGSCGVSVHAVGGPVTWSVAGTSSGLSAVGGGRLSKGASETVTVRLIADCPSSGNGFVRFSPNGSAPVSWQCAGG
ncbi:MULTISPECIES: RNA polymerase sigma factor [Actinomadura]|uniref:RNA polymerase sigma factor n=1 Tax=Actinomadura yumaensis TaxID=111807 RepID=A0ABW2CKY3_9ACTN|nr:sigma-70 family RNA polymerase sigma factor [Actinomadura sp. J1-007]MWK37203.1 sigma-70 family RNA polymerase sigma factor [Actinomadura sp. J1-007]